MQTNKRSQAGFTLIEMLVVVSLLAATAYIATGAYSHFLRHSEEQLVYGEMQEIANAIRQFKQDSGYYPKTGPFDLSLVTADHGRVHRSDLPSFINGRPDAEIRRWFYSPANLYQLTSAQKLTTNHPLGEWNAETGRGWRGPYIVGFKDGYVDIRSGINSDLKGPIAMRSAGDKTGDPLTGTNIKDVTGLADSFIHKFRTIGGNTLLDWSRTHRGSATKRLSVAKWGRPYLVFGWNGKPQLVSMGPNGTFNKTTEDDIVLQIE